MAQGRFEFVYDLVKEAAKTQKISVGKLLNSVGLRSSNVRSWTHFGLKPTPRNVERLAKALGMEGETFGFDMCDDPKVLKHVEAMVKGRERSRVRPKVRPKPRVRPDARKAIGTGGGDSTGPAGGGESIVAIRKSLVDRATNIAKAFGKTLPNILESALESHLNQR